MRFHHFGVVVADITAAVQIYKELLGYDVVVGPVVDPIQKVSISMLSKDGITVELVEPSDDSPVKRMLARSIAAYHTCYEVDDILGTLARAQERGCRVVSEPVPAVVFGGRQIAWLYTPIHELIEVLQR